MDELELSDRNQTHCSQWAKGELGFVLETNQENTQTLLGLINSLPGVVFVATPSPDLTMLFLSQGCLELTGYQGEELAGKNRISNYNALTHADDIEPLFALINQAIADKTSYVAEYRICTKAGEEKWVWEKGRAVYDSNGQPLRVEGFIIDVTERKRIEEALRRSEARFRAIFENAAIGVGITNLDGTLIENNPTLVKMLGYAADELQTIHFRDITHPDDVDADTVLFQELILGSRDSYQLEKRYLTKAGELYWGRLTISAVRDADGQLQFSLALVEDITERKLAEEALRTSEAANRQKEAFLRLILDNIPQHIFWKDRNLVYQGANRLLAQAAGLDNPDAIVGQTDYELWNTEQAKLYQRFDRQLLETGEPQLHRIGQKIQANGQIVWQDLSKVPIHDADGQIIGILGTYEDITERRQAELLLAKRQQYLAALVEVQHQLLTLEENDLLYHTVLASLGQASGASRVCIFKTQPVGSSHLRLSRTTEWCAEQVSSYPNDLSHLFYQAICPSWLQQLQRGDMINALVADSPELERQVLESQHIRSILALPLTANGNFFGFICFNNCLEARLWEPMEIDLLRAATGAIALAQERWQARNDLKLAETKYRSIFENAVEGIFQSTLEGRYLTVNPMLARIYGYNSPEDLIASITDIEQQVYVNPQRRREFVCSMQERGAVLGFESEIYRKDGSTIWISECTRAIYNSVGQIERFEGTIEDITRRKQTEAELLKRDNLLRGVAEATNCLLTNANLSIAIDEALKILGKTAQVDRVYIYENHPHPLTGELAMSIRYEWVQPAIKPAMPDPLWYNLPYHKFAESHYFELLNDGHILNYIVRDMPPHERALLQIDHIVSLLIVPIFVDGQFWGYIGFDDCHSERRWSASEESILVAIAASIGGAIKRQHTEEQMRHQAFHDALTGLPNRLLFDHHLSQALLQAQRTEELMAVMFLDLDRFKTINDTLGHAVGDQLLQETTRRLNACLRTEDTIARWGGDEFTIVLPNLRTVDDVTNIAQRIEDALKSMFHIAGQDLYITSSIGIALYPHHGRDAETLLKNADAALYCAKEEGRNNYQFYATTLNSQASQLLTLDHNLHHALERNEFVLHYQPQLNVITGEVTQMEALVRWQHPQLGLVSPTTFIALAEDNGMILPIGEWVLRSACAQAVAWQAAGLLTHRVAVNLSARQFQQPDLVERIATILTDVGLAPSCLELEITETAAMRNIDFTTTVLYELRQMGVRISMDDFGTGYSSLSYLKKFPLHALKIDRSFVVDLVDSPANVAIINSIIALGHGLDLNVVAEGVETQEQMERLRLLNCHEMQGYWFSKPLSASAATQLLYQHAQSHAVVN